MPDEPAPAELVQTPGNLETLVDRRARPPGAGSADWHDASTIAPYLTWDQGKKMAEHVRFRAETGIPVYL